MRNILAAGAIACFSLTSALAQDVEVNAETVVAVVNGTEITVGHMILLRTQLPEQYLTAPDEILFEGILEQLIDQTLLGDTVGEDTLELRLTLENESRALKAAIAIDGVIGQPFSDEAIAAAYDEAYGNLPAAPEFNASHILVATEEEAQALVVALNDGTDFAELAKEKSTGPSGPNGGELGWFGLGMMVQPFEETVLGLEVGKISAPVQTQFGWHVLILNDKRDASAPALEAVIAEITQGLQQVALNAKVNELREGGSVETMVESIDPAAIKNLDLLDQ
ncbi:peptidylprolyl isomerase [Rhodobacterales bacterium 52_120_T64]|nr:peptidylprolyl isomerase [Rhodobacterales bacterium 52_120_T64]